MTDRMAYWHWFHGLYGVSVKEKQKLLELHSEVERWYQLAREKKTMEFLETVPLKTEKQAERRKIICSFLESEVQFEKLKNSYELLKKKKMKLCCIEDDNYPKRLKQLADPPFVLYYFGELPYENVATLAIIGARSCSVYGEEIAASFAEELSEAGIQIISGMARGIDAAAQRAAIKRKGRAYAILGSGADVCYPRENLMLYESLCSMGGVISEEIPGTQPFGRNFPKRNRLIAGFSDAVLVVEARERSGSLITVSHALEQGKDIYAIPGRIYERLAQGSNRLIQEGAFLVQKPEEILQNLRDTAENFIVSKKAAEGEIQKNPNLLLETEEKIVYACLRLHPKHIEQICYETGISMSKLTVLLFQMEMKHYIKQPIKNYYMIPGLKN